MSARIKPDAYIIDLRMGKAFRPSQSKRQYYNQPQIVQQQQLQQQPRQQQQREPPQQTQSSHKAEKFQQHLTKGSENQALPNDLPNDIGALIKQRGLTSLSQSKLRDFAKIQVLTFEKFFMDLWINKNNKNPSCVELTDICAICQFPLFEVNDKVKIEDIKIAQFHNQQDEVIQIECGHYFHTACVENGCGDKTYIQCSVCSSIFGIKTGDQPKGTMKTRIEHGMHCQGYNNCGTIVISYDFPDGIKDGTRYSGTSRTAYLPNNQEGKEVLALLQTAFDRKLVFTVGRSITTGRDNCVVFNGIHLKTNTQGGTSQFGYPDPTYFQRVKQELALKGIK